MWLSLSTSVYRIKSPALLYRSFFVDTEPIGSDPPSLCRVIEHDTLEGEDVIQLFTGRDSHVKGMLSFQAVFANGIRGIYLAEAAPGRAEIIGNGRNGISYWDVAEFEWSRMTTNTNNLEGDIAAGDFSGNERADVVAIFSSCLWYQDGDPPDWTKVSDSVPDRLTAGDVTGE